MATQTNQPWPPGDGESGSADAREAAQDKAHEMAGQAQEKAHAAAGQAQAKLREQLDQRSSQLAAQINGQASDLRSVSDSLREQDKEGPAKVAERLAAYAEKVGGYLHEKDSDALLRDAEDLGRRKPALVAGGGLLLGFAASRFLKASSGRRYSARSAERLTPPRPALPSRTAAGEPRGLRPDMPGGAPPVPGAVPPAPGAVTPAPGAVPPAPGAVTPAPGAAPPITPGI
jgi:hypothetical protein